MNLNDYQKEASKTIPEDMDKETMGINACFGLAGETGEVVDLVKKHMFQGHKLNKNELILELGDILWYIAEFATALDVDLDDIAEANIKKLRVRYGEKFEVKKSVGRLK